MGHNNMIPPEDVDVDKLIEDATGSTALQPGPQPQMKHPEGWVPGIDTEKGTVTILADISPKHQNQIDWSSIVEGFGFDPEYFTVEDDRIQVRSWDTNVGRQWQSFSTYHEVLSTSDQKIRLQETRMQPSTPQIVRLYYYKATIVRKWRDSDSLKDLIKLIRRRRPHTTKVPSGDAWLLTFWADTQLGKRDEGGTKKVVEAVLNLNDLVLDRKRDLINMGYDVSKLAILGMGDLIEGCTGFYPHQEFQVELNLRDQMNVGTDLFLKTHTHLADHFTEIQSAAVGGNHGENRKMKGGSYTEDADNFDLKIWDDIRRVIEHNEERYGHIKFAIPRGEMWLQFQFGETLLSITHGHVATRGNAPAKAPFMKVYRWWEDHIVATTPGLWDSGCLVAGHYHHRFQIAQSGRELHGCPALEAGSDWFRQRAALYSPQGLLTAVADSTGIHSWQVLDPWG